MTSQRRVFYCFLTLMVAVLCALSAGPNGLRADEATDKSLVPFVAGFDRFARHDDVGSQTAGHLLITELSCTACHSTPEPLLAPKRGPVLQAAGTRLQASWIRKYLLNPGQVKPGTTMPDLLASLPPDQQAPAADALTAFLTSLQNPFPEIKATGANPVPLEFWNHGDAAHGQQLFHEIGCVACHEPHPAYSVTAVRASPLDTLLEQLEPDELKELGLSSAARRVESVPLPNVAEKYTRQSLTYFLLNPEHTRPSGRMPNFSLPAVDAADIAAWLLSEFSQSAGSTPAARSPMEVPAGAPLSAAAQIERGRQLFTELRCANCHDVQDVPSRPVQSPLQKVRFDALTSCVTTAGGAPTQHERGQPRFVLDEAQLAALQSAVMSSSAPHSLSLTLLQQNCYACHERETVGGVGRFRRPYFETVGHVDIGDEGRLPPALTGVGARLTPGWLNAVFSGKGNIRPHMTIRMPVFPSAVTQALPALLSAADATTDSTAASARVFATGDRDVLVAAGRTLMDTGCVQCHSFKGAALPGTVGVDLAGVEKRLQPGWTHDFLKDPGALKPRTRMPTFFPNGQSQNPDVLNGDVELQLAAMWAYMSDLNRQPLPARIEAARAQTYELTPTDRPIVLRTFMPVAGTHAIAVGFPQRVHFAFDAESVSLAQLWRGRFLDAEGTWFVRFAPPASPLGSAAIPLPRGPLLTRAPDESSVWPLDAAAVDTRFRGYRLDDQGVPTFLYDVGSWAVEDRIEPDAAQGLHRSIALRPVPKEHSATTGVWLRVLTGTTLQPLPGDSHASSDTPQAYINEQGTSARILGTGTSSLRTVDGQSEWVVDLSGGTTDASAVVIQYHW